MIKYSSETYNLGLSDNVTCYMIELWNDCYAISCRTIIHLPETVRDIKVWIVDSVVAIPDIGFSFKKTRDLSPAAITDLIYNTTDTSVFMAAALAITIEVMERVVSHECECWDSQTNFADIDGNLMDFRIYDDDGDDLPF